MCQNSLRSRRQRPSLGARLISGLAGVLLAVSAADAQFLLTDRTSEVYYRFGVVSGEDVLLADGAKIVGDLHCNGRVRLQPGSFVEGDVTAAGRLDNRGTVTGSASGGVDPVVLPELFDEATARELASRTVDGDTELDDELLDDVLFVDGTVRIEGRLDGRGTLIATGDIRFGPSSGDVQLDPQSRLSLIAFNDIRVDKERPFRGALYAGRDVQLEKGLALDGVLIARRAVQVKKDAVLSFVDLDPSPPEIVVVSPPAGGFTADPTPTIVAELSDDLSGIRLESVRLSVDGIDRTAAAVIGESGLSFTPADPLDDGTHTVEISATDHSDNTGEAASTFTVDTVAPTLTLVEPDSPLVVDDPTPRIRFAYSDDRAGIDLASFRLRIDGVPVAECTAGAGEAVCEPPVLADGRRTIEGEVRDAAGNSAAAAAVVVIDVEPPTLEVRSPTAGLFVDPTVLEPIPEILLAYSDAGVGVDALSLRVELVQPSGILDYDGSCTASPDSAQCPMPLLGEGSYELRAQIDDMAGHRATAALSFGVDFSDDDAPPSLTVAQPAAPKSFVSSPLLEVTGTVDDDSEVAGMTVNNLEPTIEGTSFRATVPLEPGENRVLVRAVDFANKSTAITRLVVLDTEAPELTITAPRTGTFTADPELSLVGEVHDTNVPVTLEVRGAGEEVSRAASGRFEIPLTLAEGVSRIEVTARDAAGNATSTLLEVTHFTPPVVTLTAPSEGSLVDAATVDVRGTVDDPGAGVVVNGIAATVTGTSFAALGVPLVEGVNPIVAVATDAAGGTGKATVMVLRDSSPPLVSLRAPADGSTVHEDVVAVAGTVRDLLPAASEFGPPTVHVNGVAARVSGTDFLAEQVPLVAGDNVLTITAADAAGNLATVTAVVRYEPLDGRARIEAVAGDGQSAPAGSPLADPLVVRLVDAGGVPAAGETVVFRVLRDSGSLAGAGATGRVLAVVTDAAGRAAAAWTLGRKAGAGSNMAEATAVGFAGRATFHASAEAGDLATLLPERGGGQTGEPGRPLFRPLVALAADADGNPLAGVPVTFRTVQGGGSFAGAPEVTVETAANGRAAAWFTLGPEEGRDRHAVVAEAAGLPETVLFVASALRSGDAGRTAITGVVLDAAAVPMPGVTLRVAGTDLSTQSDAAGRFRLEPVPVGVLVLVADGSTAQVPGIFPRLPFEIVTVAGRDNELDRPIYLLALDTQNGIEVGPTQGGEIGLPGAPGFALSIEPGSATFGDGGHTGVVSVTVVHSDRVPMEPGAGEQPRLVVTIQPPDVHFDPPARLTLPNVEALPPGAVTEVVSFLHAQGEFVTVGTATVSEDGSVVTTDPGNGIVAGGWHYQPRRSSPRGNVCHVPEPQCQRCTDTGIENLAERSCDDGRFCTQDDVCNDGMCAGVAVEDEEVGSFELDFNDFAEAASKLAKIGKAATLNACDFPEPSGSVSGTATRFRRCCEDSKREKLGSEVAIEASFEGSIECFVPGLTLPIPGVGAFGAFLGAKVEGSISTPPGALVDPCPQPPGCGGLLAVLDGASGSFGLTLSGGAQLVVFDRDVLSAQVALVGGGAFQGKISCAGGFELRPESTMAKWVFKAKLLDFITITEEIEIDLPLPGF